MLLRKRSLIETVNDQLKHLSQIEHSRHRSVANFLVNLVAGLIAYTSQPQPPSLYPYATGCFGATGCPVISSNSSQ